jgi:hypothetical protein
MDVLKVTLPHFGLRDGLTYISKYCLRPLTGFDSHYLSEISFSDQSGRYSGSESSASLGTAFRSHEGILRGTVGLLPRPRFIGATGAGRNDLGLIGRRRVAREPRISDLSSTASKNRGLCVVFGRRPFFSFKIIDQIISSWSTSSAMSQYTVKKFLFFRL